MSGTLYKNAQSPFRSPLEDLLAKLRQKYAAEAGPIGGFGQNTSDALLMDYSFLMDYSLLPSSSHTDGDFADKMKHFGEEDSSGYFDVKAERRKSNLDRKKIMRRRSSMTIRSMGSTVSVNSSEGFISPLPTPQKRLSMDDEGPTNHVVNSFLDQNAAFILCTSRYRSGLASSSHVEHLLACAPHLRHISPGSAEMQGSYGNVHRNPIATFLSNVKKSDDSSKTGATYMLDYRTCLARKQTDERVAMELATFVRILANEMQMDEFAIVETEIFASILALMHSNDHNSRLAGVAAISALINVTSADEEKKATKFAKNLGHGWRANNVDFQYLSAITKAFGKMALGSNSADYIECELPKAIEFLRKDRSDRRLAAVLILKELSHSAPGSFYSKIERQGGANEYIKEIFPVLLDPQPIVRVCAADALAEYIKILVDPTRQHNSTTLNLCQVFAQVMKGFNSGKSNGPNTGSGVLSQSEIEAAEHSSLLIVGDLLDLPLDFMLPRFDTVCQNVLALKNHPKELIQLEVIRLIPRLAAHSPGSFRRKYLEESLAYVMNAAQMTPHLRSGFDLRPSAFFSLGQLVLAVCKDENGERYVPKETIQIDKYVSDDKQSTPKVLYHMKDADIFVNMKRLFDLVSNGLESVRTEALHCGADITEALGPDAEKFIHEMISNMFLSGLSEDLISCLRSIAGSLPTKAEEIENRLLQELSMSLAGTTAVKEISDPLLASPYRIPEDSMISVHDFPSARQKFIPKLSINMQENPHSITRLQLALRTLRSFGSIQCRNGLSLLPFVRDVVAQYLIHPSQDVRKEAALTCISVLLPHSIKSEMNQEIMGAASVSVVEEVLQKLLRVAVSDSSPIIRHCIVHAFDDRYDCYLCQTPNLPPLFLLMQDEALSVRVVVLEILGRLARLNPAPILPEARKLLVELITELQCSGEIGPRKEAVTRLLICFFKAKALHRIVHPFLQSIIEVLPLRGGAPRVTTAALEALGELAQIGKENLSPWLHKLVPLILDIMRDQSSTNQQRLCLKTLGRLAASTGYIVDPYIDYPQLLSQAVSVLPATKKAPWPLRQEVIRALGILGALDPDQFNPTDASGRKGGGGVGSGYFISSNESLPQRDARQPSSSAISITKSPSSSYRVDYSIPENESNSLPQPGNLEFGREEGAGNKRSPKADDDDADPAHLCMYELYTMAAQPISKISPAQRLTPLDEGFYPTVALQALTSILKDPALAAHHQEAMTAIMFIFNSLGLRCVPFLRSIVPYILQIAKAQVSLREALLQQIASLSGIVKENFQPYVPAVFDIVIEFWNTKHLATVLDLVQKIAIGVPVAFKEYVPTLINRFLISLDAFSSACWKKKENVSDDEINRLKLVIKSISSLRENLVDHVHLLLPALLKLIESLILCGLRNAKTQEMCKSSVDTISLLLGTDTPTTLKGQQEQLPSLVAQPLIRLLAVECQGRKEVGATIISCLCICAKNMGNVRWISLFHCAARDAMVSWNSSFSPHRAVSTSGGDIVEEYDPSSLNYRALKSYDNLMQNFTSPTLKQDSETNEDYDSIQSLAPENSRYRSLQEAHTPAAVLNTNQLKLSAINLKNAWDISQKSTREDWDEWMRKFAISLLREAPAPSLRSTAELAYAYQPLARELFSAAFACCWNELNDQYRADLIESLKAVFFADASPEILQTLLNLAEYAERDGLPGGLPIEIGVLADLALKCRSYAKALHYKEKEYAQGDVGNCIADLITINKKLDLPEAALGVLKAAQFQLERNGTSSWYLFYSRSLRDQSRTEFSSRIFHRHRGEGLAYSITRSSDEIAGLSIGGWENVEMQESWLSKLGSWADALALYENRLEKDPDDIEALLGCMNCLNARGEWNRVLELADHSLAAISSNTHIPLREKRKALDYCAQASWRLNKWQDLEKYSKSLLESSPEYYVGSTNYPLLDFDGSFYSAILNIHRKEWDAAAIYIDAARKAMDSRFTALMAESRKRAYPSMVTAQILAEMEEIIAFRQLEEASKEYGDMHVANKEDEIEARERLIALWRKRLAGCRADAEVHSSILAVRSLVLGPTDEVDATLTLSALSRQAQAYKISERVLLEPLEQLGADLNSSIFGHSTPDHLKMGLFSSRNAALINYDPDEFVMNLISGDPGQFFPEYSASHCAYNKELIKQAGGLERLYVQQKLYFAYVKHLWLMNSRDEAFSRLSLLANIVDLVAHFEAQSMKELRTSCWLKFSEWRIDSTHNRDVSLTNTTQAEVLIALKRATFQNHDDYKSWHVWSLFNFRLAQQYDESRLNTKKQNYIDSTTSDVSLDVKSAKIQTAHVVASVKGFVKAICVGTKRWSASVLQDLLNFLTCLFKYAKDDEVAAVVSQEIELVALEAWLGVLPQLLARIQITTPSVRSILHNLLIRLGEKHPQALMYPLSVLVKSPVTERREAADSLMNSLKKHSYGLVGDALMVSSELIRVAILWLEQWHEGLEDASRLYYGEGNVSAMLEVLLPLHEALERGPSTHREQDFYAQFGRDLSQAHKNVKEYVRLVQLDGGKVPTRGGFLNSDQSGASLLPDLRQKAEDMLNQAWDLYYSVFRRINKQLPGLTTLELSQCSPALLQAHHLELGVPGSYRVDGSFVKIESFYPTVQVITSKQRPRKIVLRGEDGKDYVFLLKGHEDLRQDERVMQLFGLVNALLARDRRTNNHHLNIQRYTITPLSHNAGIVGWVPHCDTIHSLIRDYRASKSIPLNMENREMLKLTQDYDFLTVMQKVEVFSDALDRTTGKGNDIHEVLWINSTNSEEWLDRRTKFTRSIAVMSMVGYILGLGDRHPSNLMVDQLSGRVLHIDFGDCFEVAMHREKYPEKVPFRLTRMLIKAMEVSEVEGNYRNTCERTMGVLRDNKDSLVAMLEAFVYDPLISWRLLGQGTEEDDLIPKNETEDETVFSGRSKQSRQHLSKSFVQSKSLATVPIQENVNEEEDDSSDENFRHDDDAKVSQKSAIIQVANSDAAHSNHHRSLQMYSEMQNLAANLNISSRIASISGDISARNFASESLSRSRVDRSARHLASLTAPSSTALMTSTNEALNERALKVIRRVQDKLTGTDFHLPGQEQLDPVDVQDQVQRLIVQATSTENLSQLFIGWCAFW